MNRAGKRIWRKNQKGFLKKLRNGFWWKQEKVNDCLWVSGEWDWWGSLTAQNREGNFGGQRERDCVRERERHWHCQYLKPCLSVSFNRGVYRRVTELPLWLVCYYLMGFWQKKKDCNYVIGSHDLSNMDSYWAYER